MIKFSLLTPEDVAGTLALRIKELRLAKKWKQKTLAERSGVSEASLKRFEQTGKVSLESLLKIVSALGRLDDLADLLKLPKASSMKELEALQQKKAKRGSI